MDIKKEKILIKDMYCKSCEKIIEKVLRKLPGIINVVASYEEELVFVEYDKNVLTMVQIEDSIISAGYSIKNKNSSIEIKNLLGILSAGLIIIFLGKYSGYFNMDSMLNGKVGYLILFTVGLFTSLHCLGMCGGIMLSQTVTIKDSPKSTNFKPAIFYNLGRVISYTFLGGIIGALGSLFSLSIYTKAFITIFAGVFMIIMGFNMAGFYLFKKLSLKFQFISCKNKLKSSSPFIVGILNGFMPCGPLQTMQLYALGTGSFLGGATSMFFFSLGTLPLMLFFGALTGFLSKNYTKKILKLSGVLVLILGLIMTNRGLSLNGVNLSSFMLNTNSTVVLNENKDANFVKAELKNGYQEVTITALASGYFPNVVYVEKNIPVKLTILGDELTSCNNEVVIPTYNLQKKLISGETIFEFTPDGKDISFSCWMGMLNGIIKVTDDLNSIDQNNVDTTVPFTEGCCGEETTSNASSTESIYGSDLNSVSTEKLIKKTEITDDKQTAIIQGIQYEFYPLITVVQKDLNLFLTIDLQKFIAFADNISIYDLETQTRLYTSDITDSLISIDMTFNESKGYGILIDDSLISIIEVVDSLETSDLEAIRNIYLP
ncbi:sulfite exporter TauE/SafE family protein [Clostridium grantii]|uniref:Sulfite exporter TauE/SafE n=1 Tax=Clostridium grantii DSM 8605 TaxID=1121316 RepID=A0A1M5X089_9CLOT|nr:sulfite exporter TauE/SafE family protein [Clostridium grantii]SHH93326.1 Sulfite exporter TauE/SafE [Clostridium grantii DSM 8605]